MPSSQESDPLAGIDPVDLANEYLNGVRPPRDQNLALPKALARNPTFGLGLRVFQRQRDDEELALTSEEMVQVAQSAALCAYKDPDVPAGDGLDRAIVILERHCDLQTSDDPETLGLAGAITKRKWERQGRTVDLRASVGFYRRSFMGAGWESGEPPGDVAQQRRRIARDLGYNAINAAFMSDVFAAMLEAAGESDGASRHRREAQRIRDLILEVFAQPPAPAPPPIGSAAGHPAAGRQLSGDARKSAENLYWGIATRLEAALGLGRYDEAKGLVGEIDGLPLFSTPDEAKRNSWMRQTTAKQLAKLVRLRRVDPSEKRPAEVLAALLGGDVQSEAIGSLMLGKLGLALSGGGFRAAFYHIGVLAYLAERDALRYVEVISTVSGGSILGAAYYMLLKRRLEDRGELGPADYLEIVSILERSFLLAVQTDLRSTLYSELPLGLDHLLRPGATVGEAMSRKLETLFYKPRFESADAGVGAAGESDAGDRIYMDELMIHPPGDPGFHPRHHNWSRRSKVPLLVVNATALNTGHVWQFTSSFSGESPYAIDQEVDSNDRLRRFYYAPRNAAGTSTPIPGRRMTLGTAVAASACVPGLFPAVEFENLYQGYGVRLVDGGVHDNLGVVSLLEQDCTQIIISDACGQMTTEAAPGGVGVAPLMRANSIGMERLRQEEYRRVEALRQSALLGGLLFVHLRQGLAGDAVDWQDCEDLRQRPLRPPLLGFGVRREYQESLAAMRTDLDAFSDVEAYALMYSGYAMTRDAFAKSLPDLARLVPASPAVAAWRFLSVEPLMTEHPPADPRQRRFRELLHEGSKQTLRDAPQATLGEHLVPSWAKRFGKPLAVLALAALPVLTTITWLLFGREPALWTALGLLVAGTLTVGVAIAYGYRALEKAARKAGFEGLVESLPNVLYAGVLLGARRFSRVHLARYKDRVLHRGTVESLRLESDAAGDPLT